MGQPQIKRYGELDSYVIDVGEDATSSALVVLCHGYGAPGSDMVGIVGEWIRLLGEAAEKFRFVCPIAPLSLAELGLPTGRAWWLLNMAQLMESIEANRFDELHSKEPPGIETPRDSLIELVKLCRNELAQERGCDSDAVPVAMGGFSQGAMLSMDSVLRGEIDPPQLLMLFSGTLICEPQWTENLDRLKQSRVYQSHGTLDPLLPFTSAERLRDLMTGAGIEVQFHSFLGPHTIDTEAIASTAVALQQLVGA